MDSRVAIRRHESELGSWEMATRAPRPALAGAVQRYVGYMERTRAPLRRREIPQERVTVILGFGPAMTVEGRGLAPEPRTSFVAPLTDAYGITEFAGMSHGIQVDLSPLAARALLGVPMHELRPVVIGLGDILGRDAERLVERLYDAPGWDGRFALLDRAIARRLDAARRPPPDVVWAWRRLRETGGRMTIGALAAELGCSRRHLVSRFRDHVGPAPKTAARILRFRRLVEALERDDGARLAQIAQACGYYDQSHLNRDFRELAGVPPSAYIGARLPDGIGVRA